MQYKTNVTMLLAYLQALVATILYIVFVIVVAVVSIYMKDYILVSDIN